MELLALLAVLIAGYAVAGLVYRRYRLGNRLHEAPISREPDASPRLEGRDIPDGDGVLCPACGAANESGYARCFNCAKPLPGG